MQTELKMLSSNNLTDAEIYEHKFIHNLAWSKYDDYSKDCNWSAHLLDRYTICGSKYLPPLPKKTSSYLV
jgi:hypothetical protein